MTSSVSFLTIMDKMADMGAEVFVSSIALFEL
jgi:hypothetical protein